MKFHFNSISRTWVNAKWKVWWEKCDIQTDRQTDRKKDWQMDRDVQTDRQTKRKTDRWTDRQTTEKWSLSVTSAYSRWHKNSMENEAIAHLSNQRFFSILIVRKGVSWPFAASSCICLPCLARPSFWRSPHLEQPFSPPLARPPSDAAKHTQMYCSFHISLSKAFWR